MSHGSSARRIDRVMITVPNLRAAAEFYGGALGFRAAGVETRLGGAERARLGTPDHAVSSLTLRLGMQRLDLLAFDPPGRNYPAGSTSTDLWFQHCAIVVTDMPAAFAHVSRYGITAITTGGPQTLPPNTGSVSAFKFRDPFGHPFELLSFPQGVGDPQWQNQRGLFVGIDHTAIAVGGIDRSVAFYEALGFERLPGSHNVGAAQTKLDGVAHDAVSVVPLSPAERLPHLELLGYETGRRRPAWGRLEGDIALTYTVIDVAGLPALLPSIERLGGRILNTAGSGATVEDPDRHALLLQDAA